MTKVYKLPPLPEWLEEQEENTTFPVSTIRAAMKQYASYAVKINRQNIQNPDWNMSMAGIKKLIPCTDGELESIGENLLDSYSAEVNEIFTSMLEAAPSEDV